MRLRTTVPIASPTKSGYLLRLPYRLPLEFSPSYRAPSSRCAPRSTRPWSGSRACDCDATAMRNSAQSSCTGGPRRPRSAWGIPGASTAWLVLVLLLASSFAVGFVATCTFVSIPRACQHAHEEEHAHRVDRQRRGKFVSGARAPCPPLRQRRLWCTSTHMRVAPVARAAQVLVCVRLVYDAVGAAAAQVYGMVGVEEQGAAAGATDRIDTACAVLFVLSS